MKITTRHARRPLAARTVTDPDTGRVYPIPSGGSDDGDRLEQLVARIGSDSNPLSDEELAEAEQLAVAAFDDADGDDPDVEAMQELAGVISSVREEQDARDAAAEERREQAASLRDTIHATDDDATDDDDDVTDEVDDDATAESDDAPEASDEDVDTSNVPDDASSIVEEESVAASASTPARPTLGAAARRRRRVSTPQPQRRNLTVVTAGDVPGMSAGTRLDSLSQVGDAFASKAHAVLAGRGRGRFGVASFQLDLPEDRMLGHNAQVNEERIDAVVASAQSQTPDAIVAAGGLCAPVDAAYDLDGISVESRPIRDSLVRFGADRGGIRFITPPSLADVADSVGVWTELNDRDPGATIPDTEPAETTGPETKPILTITCGEEVEVLVDAITRAIKVGNFSRRTFPEQFARFWQLSGVAHSRLAEETLWDRMVAQATAVTSAQVLGASRDLLSTVDLIVAGFRSRHRMSDNATLRVILPTWARQLIRVDLARQLAGDESMNVSDAQIDAHFANRGAVVTYSPDVQVFAAQGAGAVTAFPGTVEALVFPEGSYTFLDGGTLDFGMEIRDSSLNRTNDVEAFMETFENVAFRGIEALHVTSTVEPNGSSSGTVDLTA